MESRAGGWPHRRCICRTGSGDLAKIHAATAGRGRHRPDLRQWRAISCVAHRALSSFHRGRHADLAPRIQAIADGIEKARIALMQGDISPKNILVGPRGPCSWTPRPPVTAIRPSMPPSASITFCSNASGIRIHARLSGKFSGLEERVFEGRRMGRQARTGSAHRRHPGRVPAGKVDGNRRWNIYRARDKEFVRKQREISSRAKKPPGCDGTGLGRKLPGLSVRQASGGASIGTPGSILVG